MLTMKSMELTDEEQFEATQPIPMPDKPKYPYGLRICLTDQEFAKLKLDAKDFEIGGTIHGHFMGRITSVSASDGEYGNNCRVEIQIEELSIESEDAENEADEEKEKPSRVSRLRAR